MMSIMIPDRVAIIGLLLISLIGNSIYCEPITGEGSGRSQDGSSSSSGSRLSSALTPEQYAASPYYVPPFKPDLEPMSAVEHAKLERLLLDLLQLYKNALADYVKPRQSFISMNSMKRIYEATTFICKTSYRIFQEGIQIAPEFPVDDALYQQAGVLGSQISARADQLIRERGYKKSNLDKKRLNSMSMQMFDIIENIVTQSPYGLYLNWNSLANYRDPMNPDQPLDMIEHISDVIAQLKTTGLINKMSTLQSVFRRMRSRNEKANKGLDLDSLDEGVDSGSECSIDDE